MKTESCTEREFIRNDWSDVEKERRRRIAEKLQFCLFQIVVLAELAHPKPKTKRPKLDLICNT